MNQEIKDTLAGLTRQADKLEEFDCSDNRFFKSKTGPSPSDFITAQRYRALVRHIEELHKMLGDVTDALESSPMWDDDGVQKQAEHERQLIVSARKLLNP